MGRTVSWSACALVLSVALTLEASRCQGRLLAAVPRPRKEPDEVAPSAAEIFAARDTGYRAKRKFQWHPRPAKSANYKVGPAAAGPLPPEYNCSATTGAPCHPQRLLGLPACPKGSKAPNPLYGCKGEKFGNNGRLMDYSYAGYRFGEKPLPLTKCTVTIAAISGDDITQSFKDAIRQIETANVNGTVCFPRGNFTVKDQIVIKGNVQLRGAGRDATILFFPYNLRRMLGGAASLYSYRRGVIEFQSWDLMNRWTELTKVTRDANAGANTFYVASTNGIQVGGIVRLSQDEAPDQSLAVALLDQQFPDTRNLYGMVARVFRLTSRVVDKGRDWVKLERNTYFPVKIKWNATVHTYNPWGMYEAGMRDLTIQFPCVPYGGHGNEQGYNAVQIHSAHNSFMLNIAILNADSGIIAMTQASTFRNILFRHQCRRDFDNSWFGRFGCHFGISIGGAMDNVFENITVDANCAHDTSTYGFAAGNVFSRVKGRDLNLDHHKEHPHHNLFVDIDCGNCTRLLFSGGPAKWGVHSAKAETLWGIRRRPGTGTGTVKWGTTTFGTTMGDPFGPSVNCNGNFGAVMHPSWRRFNNQANRNLWRDMRRMRVGAEADVY